MIDKHLKLGSIDSYAAYQMRDLVLRLRTSAGILFDYNDQPIPYFYYYFIGVVSSLYLPLFAIAMAYSTPVNTKLRNSFITATNHIMNNNNETNSTDSTFYFEQPETDYATGNEYNDNNDMELIHNATAAIAVLLNTFFISGLRILYNKLADPFGNDIEDLSVMTYVDSTTENTFAALSSTNILDPSSSSSLPTNHNSIDHGVPYIPEPEDSMHQKRQHYLPSAYQSIHDIGRTSDIEEV